MKAHFQHLQTELNNNSLIKNVQFKLNEPISKEEIQKFEEFLEIPLIDSFYSNIGSLSFSWEMIEQPDEISFICGKTNILPLNEVCTNWMDILYFDEDSSLSDFYPIDMPTEETTIGIYKGNSSLHWHYAGEEKTTALNIQLNDYINFLVETKGFIYWQKALLACQNPKLTSLESKAYFKNISSLFPDSSEKSLKELFQKLKS